MNYYGNQSIIRKKTLKKIVITSRLTYVIFPIKGHFVYKKESYTPVCGETLTHSPMNVLFSMGNQMI